MGPFPFLPVWFFFQLTYFPLGEQLCRPEALLPLLFKFQELSLKPWPGLCGTVPISTVSPQIFKKGEEKQEGKRGLKREGCRQEKALNQFFFFSPKAWNHRLLHYSGSKGQSRRSHPMGWGSCHTRRLQPPCSTASILIQHKSVSLSRLLCQIWEEKHPASSPLETQETVF